MLDQKIHVSGLMQGSALCRPSLEGFPESRDGEPTWEIAVLFPSQGAWTEEQFLELDGATNWPIELIRGRLRLLPMPTFAHQSIVAFLHALLNQFVRTRKLGRAVFAPMPVRFEGDYFEPDIVFLRHGHPMQPSGHPEGADLVMEVVSNSAKDRHRDLVEKRKEYAERGIPEYWIVDPKLKTITVLALDGKVYREHGVFAVGQQATSSTLPGFSVPVSETFAAGEEEL